MRLETIVGGFGFFKLFKFLLFELTSEFACLLIGLIKRGFLFKTSFDKFSGCKLLAKVLLFSLSLFFGFSVFALNVDLLTERIFLPGFLLFIRFFIFFASSKLIELL